jgi:hypothetical protein
MYLRWMYARCPKHCPHHKPSGSLGHHSNVRLPSLSTFSVDVGLVHLTHLARSISTAFVPNIAITDINCGLLLLQGTSLNSLFWFLDLESGEVFGPQAPELQLEYFVPLKDATEALHAVQRVASKWGTPVASDPLGQPLLLYCELRVVRGDDLWLSQSTTADGGDTLALAFGMNKSDYTAAMRGATALENQLAQFSMRPHWAKLHTMTPSAVTALYGDNWGKFVDLCAAHDPDHKFLNDWATSHLYPHA